MVMKLIDLKQVALGNIVSFLDKGVTLHVCRAFHVIHRLYGCRVCKRVSVGNRVCRCGLVRDNHRGRTIVKLALQSSVCISRLVISRDECVYIKCLRRRLDRIQSKIEERERLVELRN